MLCIVAYSPGLIILCLAISIDAGATAIRSLVLPWVPKVSCMVRPPTRPTPDSLDNVCLFMIGSYLLDLVQEQSQMDQVG